MWTDEDHPDILCFCTLCQPALLFQVTDIYNVFCSDSGRGSSLLDRTIADRRQLNTITLPDFSDPETGENQGPEGGREGESRRWDQVLGWYLRSTDPRSRAEGKRDWGRVWGEANNRTLQPHFPVLVHSEEISIISPDGFKSVSPCSGNLNFETTVWWLLCETGFLSAVSSRGFSPY